MQPFTARVHLLQHQIFYAILPTLGTGAPWVVAQCVGQLQTLTTHNVQVHNLREQWHNPREMALVQHGNKGSHQKQRIGKI